ncbi:lysophospholipid acyltransferase family protein [Anaeromyxobacter oryzae]|uniref:Lipid A biosynthesis acyltransferase n=1 Tax=Anaeromyxobacter oryzae TaxID=2918170 RepID=A0ABM7WV64_9BACT|nr:lipid A biosynthesis acyltransferase [Anaeromyxobacter oryzae]BDG03285.1 lipid A biosynthesis acyltransferase [Anaeromyxobacter oryzae]
MAPPLRKQIKRRARSVLVRFAVRLLGFLPLGPALALGGFAGAVAHRLAWKTRGVALAHLALAFPEKSEAEREAIARGMFVHLARSALELAAIRSFDDRLDAYVELSPPTLLKDVIARGRGMVFVTGHVGSWELLARRIARAGIQNAVIAKASADAALNTMAERFRAEGGVTTLWRENPDTGRAIIRTFRQGKALGLLIDQDTNVQGVFVPFFGRLAFTPRAAADLAIRFGAPVVVGTIHRKGPHPGDGHLLTVTEIPFSSDPPDREAEVVRLTAACSAALEAAIRRHPEEWVWMHERWKTRPDETATGGGPQAKAVPKSADLSNR